MFTSPDSSEYRAVLEAMPDGIYILDQNLHISFANPALMKMMKNMGFASDIIGQVLTEAFPFTESVLKNEVARVFETQSSLEAENSYSVGDRTFIISAKRLPMFDRQGAVFAVLNVIRDVTEERTAAIELAEAKNRFEEMVEDSGSIMLKMDTEGRVTYWNRYAEQFFGFSREELMGKSVVGTIVPEKESTGRDLSDLMKALAGNPEAFAQNENENLRKDGSRVWVHWSNRPIFGPSGKLIELFCVGQDVTALKQAQAESEERYRYLFHESPAGSIILSADGKILDINNAFLKAFGYQREEIIGQPAARFLPEDAHPRLQEVLRRRMVGEQIPEAENRIIAKNGTIRDIVFASGQARIKDSQGRVTALVLCGADITERKENERVRARHREELLRTDRMASLGILVSGVAHEINNPNNFIILNGDNLRDIWKDIRPVLDHHQAEHPGFQVAGLPYSEVRDETGRLIHGIQEGARRIKAIVQHLKDFARQAPSDMSQSVDLNQVVEASVTILGALIRKSTDGFTFHPSSVPPLVRGDFQKLEQVTINLITNACHALSDQNAAITVTTSVLSQEGKVRLSVRDEGCGIPEEVMPHIFDPFFTTKRDQGGTGLGLSISYGIAQDHLGSLQVRTVAGRGTEFTLELPAVDLS